MLFFITIIIAKITQLSITKYETYEQSTLYLHPAFSFQLRKQIIKTFAATLFHTFKHHLHARTSSSVFCVVKKSNKNKG